ncbi:MAG: LacI family transcriptional regulator [Syntrophobacteraceae bacterium]|nr:LacI family transcriptional regulator [Syntrophobacteraceae bacterium]
MILDRGATFTAVLASNDEMALGAMQALKETGRKIPQDVAIIGFDNRLESTTQDPQLSSIHIPLYEMGYRSVEFMMRHLEGTTRLGGTVRVHTRLVTRESCGCGSYKGRSFENGINLKPQALDLEMQRNVLVETIVTTVLNQAQSLPESECPRAQSCSAATPGS